MVAMSANEVAMWAPDTGTMPGEARGSDVSDAMSTKMTATEMTATEMGTTAMAATAMAAATVAATAGECYAARERQAAAKRENCGQCKD
jgi:hypothetical protein